MADFFFSDVFRLLALASCVFLLELLVVDAVFVFARRAAGLAATLFFDELATAFRVEDFLLELFLVDFLAAAFLVEAFLVDFLAAAFLVEAFLVDFFLARAVTERLDADFLAVDLRADFFVALRALAFFEADRVVVRLALALVEERFLVEPFLAAVERAETFFLDFARALFFVDFLVAILLFLYSRSC